MVVVVGVVDVMELKVEEVEREGLEDFRGMLTDWQPRGPAATAVVAARLRRGTKEMERHDCACLRDVVR